MGKTSKTVLLAAASIGLYTALFANEATITEYYTKGSFYAALPVVTALVFSFVHGAFASQCLETLGITARKSTAPSPSITKQKQSVVKKDQRVHLNVN
jgi:L-asparagine transporter-like permease